jgi:hypothetical protein
MSDRVQRVISLFYSHAFANNEDKEGSITFFMNDTLAHYVSTLHRDAITGSKAHLKLVGQDEFLLTAEYLGGVGNMILDEKETKNLLELIIKSEVKVYRLSCSKLGYQSLIETPI